jgi:hypothetical protein
MEARTHSSMPGRLVRMLRAILDLVLGRLPDLLSKIPIDFSEHRYQRQQEAFPRVKDSP